MRGISTPRRTQIASFAWRLIRTSLEPDVGPERISPADEFSYSNIYLARERERESGRASRIPHRRPADRPARRLCIIMRPPPLKCNVRGGVFFSMPPPASCPESPQETNFIPRPRSLTLSLARWQRISQLKLNACTPIAVSERAGTQ